MAGDGIVQADEPRANQVGEQDQAHEASRPPRPDGSRGALDHGFRF